jgi:hypothetical protein
MNNPAGRMDEQTVRDLHTAVDGLLFLLENTLSDYSATPLRTKIRGLHQIIDNDVLVVGW